MFPELDLIEEEFELNEQIEWNGKSYLYDFNKGDFIYKNGALVEVTGLEALKVWIEKVIRTEKFRFKIYDDIDYGISIEDLFGSNLERYLIESEIQREITEALLKNPIILDVDEWEFEYENEKVIVSFYVSNDLENFNFEVVV